MHTFPPCAYTAPNTGNVKLIRVGTTHELAYPVLSLLLQPEPICFDRSPLPRPHFPRRQDNLTRFPDAAV